MMIGIHGMLRVNVTTKLRFPLFRGCAKEKEAASKLMKREVEVQWGERNDEAKYHSMWERAYRRL